MIKITILDENNNKINEAFFKTNNEVNLWYDSLSYSFGLNHQKIVTDATEEVKEQERVGESIEAINLGNELIAYVRKINRKKLRTGEWDNQKLIDLLSNQTAAQIERAFWNGSLETALLLINNLTGFYSNDEISYISNKIINHQTKWNDLI